MILAIIFIGVVSCALSYAWGYDDGRKKPRAKNGQFMRIE